MKILRLFAVAFVGLAMVTSSASAYMTLGKPAGYMNDYTGTLSSKTKADLEALLKSFKESGAGEISVAMISSLGGDSIENYSIEVAREWGVGVKGKDNGALLFVAKDDRELRIEVGYGFEGVLTDAKSSRIIRDVITPRFKEGNYDVGIENGVREIVGLLAPTLVGGARTIDYTTAPATSSSDLSGSFLPLLIFGFIFLQWFVAIFARSKSWWAGGIVGGIVGIGVSLFVGFLYAGAIVTVALVFLGLLFDYVISNKYSNSVSSGNKPPWWTGGGGSFGGGSSSGGFGGFGGGSFGGGGASGRW